MNKVTKIPGLGGGRVFTVIEDPEHTARCAKAVRQRWMEEGRKDLEDRLASKRKAAA